MELSFGDRLRFARKQIGLTLEELAERCRVSGASISQIETGARRASPMLAAALSRALGVREAWLTEGLEPMYESEVLDDDLRLAEKTVQTIIESLGIEVSSNEKANLIRTEMDNIREIRDALTRKTSPPLARQPRQQPIIHIESSKVHGPIVGRDLITTQKHFTRVTNVPPPGSITEPQARQLHKLITRVGELESHRSGPRGYGIAMNQFKRKFDITSYKNLPATAFDLAVEYLQTKARAIEKDLLKRSKTPSSRDDFVRRIQSICRSELHWTDTVRRKQMLERYGKASLTDFTMAELEDFYNYVLKLRKGVPK